MSVGVIDVGSNTVRLLVASVGRRRRSHAARGASAPRPRRGDRCAHGAHLGDEARRGRARYAASTRGSRASSASASSRRVVTAPGRQGDDARPPARRARHARPAATSASSRPTRRDGSPSTVPSRARSPARGRRRLRRRRRLDARSSSAHRCSGRPGCARVDLGSLRLTAALLPSDPPTPRRSRPRARRSAAGSPTLEPPRPDVALATGGSARAVARIVGHESAPTSSSESSRLAGDAAGGRDRRGATASDPSGARTLLAGALVLAEVSRLLGVAVHAARGGHPRGRRAPARRPPRSRLPRAASSSVDGRARSVSSSRASSRRHPAQLVDLVGRRRTPRRQAASASSAPASARPRRRRSASTAAPRRARSASRSPPRPRAARSPRRSRPARPCPSGTSSRRTAADARRTSTCRRATTSPPAARTTPSSRAASTPTRHSPRPRASARALLALDQPSGGERGRPASASTSAGAAPPPRRRPGARRARPGAPSPRDVRRRSSPRARPRSARA